MHTANESKIAVRKAVVSTLVLMRASGDVEVASEALLMERRLRGEIADLEKQEKEPELALAGGDHKRAA